MTALITLIGGWRATAFLALALAALTFAGVQSSRLADARTDLATIKAAAATAKAQAEHDARLAEARLATAASNADAQYARGMSDAQSAADALAVALRAGTVQLRRPWRCEAKSAPADGLPTPAGSQRSDDGTLDEQAASASRIDRATGQCDAQVATWQAYYRKARCIVNGECAP